MSRNLSRPPSSASFRKSAEHSDFNKSFNNSGSWCSEVGRPQTPLSARARMGSDSARATPVPRPHSAMGSARGGDSGGGGVKVSTVPTLSKPSVSPLLLSHVHEATRVHLAAEASLTHALRRILGSVPRSPTAWHSAQHRTRVERRHF